MPPLVLASPLRGHKEDYRQRGGTETTTQGDNGANTLAFREGCPFLGVVDTARAWEETSRRVLALLQDIKLHFLFRERPIPSLPSVPCPEPIPGEQGNTAGKQ